MKDRIKESTIRENANKIRAEIIGSAIEVEDALTEALGYLYCASRDSFHVHLLIDDILSDLTFDKKIKTFKKFVDLSPESFEHRKTLLRDLNEIREKRNQLAHRGISFPWIFDENDIDENGYNFLTKEYIDWKEKCEFHKAGKSPFTFTVAELKNYKNLCELVKISIYVALNKLLTPLEENKKET